MVIIIWLSKSDPTEIYSAVSGRDENLMENTINSYNKLTLQCHLYMPSPTTLLPNNPCHIHLYNIEIHKFCHKSFLKVVTT